MKGDFDEACEILSCSQVARAVAVISYSDGRASIRNYCPKHEDKGVAKLKRAMAGVELVDHRERAANKRTAVPQIAIARSKYSLTQP
jgi:hypothetical protein